MSVVPDARPEAASCIQLVALICKALYLRSELQKWIADAVEFEANADPASVVRIGAMLLISYLPTLMFERLWRIPKTFRSHITTAMTTTAFKIDLIEFAMGMNLFTSHRRTPTTMSVATIWSSGMMGIPFLSQ